MLRSNTAPIPTEEDEQRTLVDWLRWHGILFIHPASGGKRTRAEAGIFKAIGVSPGCPDLLIFDPPPRWPGEFRGLAIELKRRQGGRVQDTQRAWLAALEERHWYTAICRGADEAIDLLESLGYGKHRSAPTGFARPVR